MSCPSCKAPIDIEHAPEIALEVRCLKALRTLVQIKALRMIKKQGLDKDESLTTPGNFYYNKLIAFAEAKASFFMCAKCSKPFFGGIIDCEQEMGMEATTKKEDLICKHCILKSIWRGTSSTCQVHGTSFIDWKCMYCCSIAVYVCSGNRYFCEPCHSNAAIATTRAPPKCMGGANCPLGVAHPPAGPND